jgi:hypothetical protein
MKSSTYPVINYPSKTPVKSNSEASNVLDKSMRYKIFNFVGNDGGLITKFDSLTEKNFTVIEGDRCHSWRHEKCT